VQAMHMPVTSGDPSPGSPAPGWGPRRNTCVATQQLLAESITKYLINIIKNYIDPAAQISLTVGAANKCANEDPGQARSRPVLHGGVQEQDRKGAGAAVRKRDDWLDVRPAGMRPKGRGARNQRVAKTFALSRASSHWGCVHHRLGRCAWAGG
jgi:hypothetical protein